MMILFGLAGIRAAELHGDLPQKQRLEALQSFRTGEADVLLCTDVAARGIDISGVHAVINYEMPKDISTYVHRVGRTARAGRKGRSVTLTSEHRRLIMKQVARHCKGFVKSRAVPALVIEKWTARIESMEDDIKEIMKEESADRKLREAERDARKAQNMMLHQDEIFSRPPRTWFQSSKEKTNVQARAAEDRQQKAHATASTSTSTTSAMEGTSKKARMKAIRSEEARLFQEKTAPEVSQVSKKRMDAFMPEASSTMEGTNTSSCAALARASKKTLAKEKKEWENMSISEIQALKRAKQQKRKNAASNRSGNAFDVDQSTSGDGSGKTKKARKNSNTQEYVSQEFKFDGKITNLRKGGKKSCKSFKSKGRYARKR